MKRSKIDYHNIKGQIESASCTILTISESYSSIFKLLIIFTVFSPQYRVEEHGGRWCFLQKNNLPRLPSMNYQQDVIAQMLTLYPLTSLEEDTDLSKVMTVVGALINLNHLSTISISTLRAIYERSVRLATKEA